MSLLLTLERSPQPQPVRQMRIEEGKLVIGRSPEADWRIDDPDMFVSRAHCTIAAQGGRFTVTDTSSGGLYLDDAPQALGPGNAAELRDGMRLKLGDYVVRVALQEALPAIASRRHAPAALDRDDFFAPAPPEPEPPRPASLPDPFDASQPGAYLPPERQAPPTFDDPFTLDPVPTPRPGPEAGTDFDFVWDRSAIPVQPQPPPPPDPVPQPRAETGRPPDDAALRNAFLAGLGLDPAEFPNPDPVAEMEAFGRAHRLMVEGLMHLLRKRAQEKSNARLAQTVIGGTEVNPLKFMPDAEAALATMLAPRSPGFLPAEDAVAAAIRDLAEHHVAAWRGVQAALRRMIDRFDPAALEKELEQLSALQTLLAGGRRAKLWELYAERYREIARSAESRFLGEVGADFRDAYEKGGN
jgi:type VI secretion system protein ImpI